jgi:hypothetical protein
LETCTALVNSSFFICCGRRLLPATGGVSDARSFIVPIYIHKTGCADAGSRKSLRSRCCDRLATPSSLITRVLWSHTLSYRVVRSSSPWLHLAMSASKVTDEIRSRCSFIRCAKMVFLFDGNCELSAPGGGQGRERVGPNSMGDHNLSMSTHQHDQHPPSSELGQDASQYHV